MDREKNHDGTSLILITSNVNELCVISHSMKRTKERYYEYCLFSRAVQKQGKAIQHELGKVKIIHVMLLIKMSSITWKLPVSSPKMSQKEKFTRQCRTFSFRQKCDLNSGLWSKKQCFNASFETRYPLWYWTEPLILCSISPEKYEKNNVYLKVLLPRSLI